MNEPPAGPVRRARAGAAVPDEDGAPAWLSRACVIVPALDAARTLATVVRDVRDHLPECADEVLVVDDGSSDDTARIATSLGCIVIAHGDNRGKGAALRTGLATARARGRAVALALDADGQHTGADARAVMLASREAEALVLGIRDLAAAGAPRANRASNRISNFFISGFAGRKLDDTQCGLRRYPVARTLGLGASADRYDFEAEVLLRAVWAGVEIVEQPIAVVYPEDRTTHFDVVRDPCRIVRTVVATLRDRARAR